MTADEVIAALAGWLDTGDPFDPVETVEAALEILKRTPTPLGAMRRASLQLAMQGAEAWLKNSEPHVDDSLIRALLHWVQRAEGKDHVTSLHSETYDVPGIGPVPMLYVEAWGAEQGFRRLGFSRDDVYYIVADNGDLGYVRKDVLHVTLRGQGKEFTYTIDKLDRDADEALAFIRRFKETIGNEEFVSEDFATAMYRATQMGQLDGDRFRTLSLLLIAKGFVLPTLTN